MRLLKLACIALAAASLAGSAGATVYNITSLALDTKSGTDLPSIVGTGLPGDISVNYITASQSGFNDIAQFTFNVASGDTISFDGISSIAGTRAVSFLVPNGNISINTSFNLIGGNGGENHSGSKGAANGGAGGVGGFAGGGASGVTYTVYPGLGPGGGPGGPWGTNNKGASGGSLVSKGGNGSGAQGVAHVAFSPAAIPGSSSNPRTDLWGGSGGGGAHGSTNYWQGGGGGGGAIGFFVGDSAGGSYTDGTISFGTASTINVSGGYGNSSSYGATGYGAAGGGSGGTILLMGGSTGSVNLANATLTANGGNANRTEGGGGSGGEIAVYYGTGGLTAPGAYSVTAGTNGGAAAGHYNTAQLTPSVLTSTFTVSGTSPGPAVVLPTVIRGGNASANITANETGGSAGNYSVGAPSGNFAVGNSSNPVALASGGSNTHAVTYADTSTAGAASGSVAFSSGASTLSGSGTVNLSGTILDHSNGQFKNVSGAAAGTLGTNSLALNFGAVGQGSGASNRISSFFDIFTEITTSGYTAGMDLDSITSGGDTASLLKSGGADTFAGKAAENAEHYTFQLDTSVAGTFSATYYFNVSDENLDGATGKTLTLTLTGTVCHAGDINGDGVVDLQDFGTLKENFGATSGATWSTGDLNGDGAIDLQDFGVLKDHFGHTNGDVSITAVPEPATLVLLSLAAGALAARRSRKA